MNKSLMTMAVETKSKACSWNSKGKLATTVAVSLDINPNACFTTTAFLYTKRHCQKQKACLWHAQVHASGQSYKAKCEIHDLHTYSKPHHKRAYKLAMLPQLHKGFLFSEEKQFQERDYFAIYAELFSVRFFFSLHPTNFKNSYILLFHWSKPRLLKKKIRDYLLS